MHHHLEEVVVLTLIPAWLLAEFYKKKGHKLPFLRVFRSLALPHSDPDYAPVREFLESNEHEVLVSEIVEDDKMMFGRGEYTIYQILPKVGPFDGMWDHIKEKV